MVICRRALDIGIISKKDFSLLYKKELKWCQKYKKTQRASKGGPPQKIAIPLANGKNFTNALLHSVLTEETLLRDGAYLIGMAPNKLIKFAKDLYG